MTESLPARGHGNPVFPVLPYDQDAPAKPALIRVIAHDLQVARQHLKAATKDASDAAGSPGSSGASGVCGASRAVSRHTAVAGLIGQDLALALHHRHQDHRHKLEWLNLFF